MSDQDSLPSNLVTALALLRNPEGESWVTLREAEGEALVAEIERLQQRVAELEHALDGKDGWRANAKYLLDNYPGRMLWEDTEHPDFLLTSLVITFQKMQSELARYESGRCAMVSEIQGLRQRVAERDRCLEHYQARFSLITNAWRSGDNEAVLDAVRKHITAKDCETADELLRRSLPQPTCCHGYVEDGKVWHGENCPNGRAAEPPSAALRDVTAERERQKTIGWTTEHDDEHSGGELAQAAACYIAQDATNLPKSIIKNYWPYDSEYWKPKDHRRNLVRAGALILAEIERLDRASPTKTESSPNTKGSFGAECNRASCKNVPATWKHRDLRNKFYCQPCGLWINENNPDCDPPLCGPSQNVLSDQHTDSLIEKLESVLAGEKTDRCPKCNKPLPPLAEWSMPACPECTAKVEAAHEMDLLPRPARGDGETVGRAIAETTRTDETAEPLVPKYECCFCRKKFLTSEVRSHHEETCKQI